MASLIITALAVLIFRGLVEVIARKLIPSPSLFGADQSLKEEDIVARRRYWYWRTQVPPAAVLDRLHPALLLALPSSSLLGGSARRSSTQSRGSARSSRPPTLPQLALVFIQLPILFFVNFAIFFGPFLFFAVRQIRGYEPGDASWGVKIDDVRGQAEAKEEITRVITLWQSGEEFEKAGGKRERGLLFLGAPGTGKTMISKAIATNFNCPFVTIPGSGFAGMFIGMDAIIVQFLAHKARKLAQKWGGQCIVFIDEIDAVGMRRQALGRAGMKHRRRADLDPRLLFFGPNGSLTPTGDLVIESRAWRERLFAQRAEAPASGYPPSWTRSTSKVRRFYPGFGMGGGRRHGAQPAAGRDGRHRRAAADAQVRHQPHQHVPRRDVRGPAQGREGVAADAAAEAAPGADLLHRRLQRADRGARPGADPPRPDGPPHLVPDPDQGRPRDIFDLYLAKVDHEPDLDTDHRRDELARITNGYSPSMIEQCCSMALTIAHSEGRRAFGWRDIVEAMTTVEAGTAQNIDYVPEETRAVAIHEAGHAAAGHVYLGKDLLSTRLSIRKRGGSLGHYQSMEKDERFTHFRSRVMGSLIMILGAMAAEHVFYGENSPGRQRRRLSATATAASMVGMWAMGPEPVRARRLVDVERGRRRRCSSGSSASASPIMNRASGGTPMMHDPIGAVLGDRDKRRAAAQILGQAYVTAYALMATNRDAVERIADILVERKEMHGDEVVDLLDSVGLKRPEIDLIDDSTWPRV